MAEGVSTSGEPGCGPSTQELRNTTLGRNKNVRMEIRKIGKHGTVGG
jgi:hypothetical protein